MSVVSVEILGAVVDPKSVDAEKRRDAETKLLFSPAFAGSKIPDGIPMRLPPQEPRPGSAHRRTQLNPVNDMKVPGAQHVKRDKLPVDSEDGNRLNVQEELRKAREAVSQIESGGSVTSGEAKKEEGNKDQSDPTSEENKETPNAGDKESSETGADLAMPVETKWVHEILGEKTKDGKGILLVPVRLRKIHALSSDILQVGGISYVTKEQRKYGLHRGLYGDIGLYHDTKVEDFLCEYVSIDTTKNQKHKVPEEETIFQNPNILPRNILSIVNLIIGKNPLPVNYVNYQRVSEILIQHKKKVELEWKEDAQSILEDALRNHAATTFLAYISIISIGEEPQNFSTSKAIAFKSWMKEIECHIRAAEKNHLRRVRRIEHQDFLQVLETKKSNEHKEDPENGESGGLEMLE